MGAPRLDKLDKNYIVNGNFDFWQRATGSPFTGTGTASGYAWADKFKFSASTTNNRANRAVNRSTSVPSIVESGFRSTYSMEYTQTSALALAASDFLVWCWHIVEGNLYRELHGGKITLSFMFRSTVAGQYPVSFKNSASTRSYVTLFNYTTANVWQKIYVTIDTDIGGTWLFDHQAGINITVGSQAGSTYQTNTLNQWQNGDFIATAQGVQVQSQTAITINIAQMKLSAGSTQQEFSLSGLDYQGELEKCRRYCQSIINVNGGNQATGIIGQAHTATTQFQANIRFGTPMRATPVMSFTGQVPFIVGGGVNTSISGGLGAGGSLQNTDVTDFIQTITTTSAMTLGNFYRMEYPGGSAAGSRILFDADL